VPEQPHQQRRAETYPPEPTGWVGWIAFAGIMMMMLGSFHAIAGLVGIFQDKYYLVGSSQLVIHADYTTWGWVHLIAGIVIACAGAALLTGQMWARVVAILCAFASALINVAFLSAYPIWSTIMITVDILVIWAVMVHGREMRKSPGSGY
jgi:hypothetical protein